MKTIVVSRAVLRAFQAMAPKTLADDARLVDGGWELEVTDEAYRRILENQSDGETISDVLMRVLKLAGKPGVRRAYQRIERRQSRQRASRRRTRKP